MSGAVEQAQFIADLADAEADVFGVGDRVARIETQLQVIELRAAVAVWPPEARMLQVELCELGWCELHDAFTGRQSYALVYRDAFDRGVECCVNRRGREVCDRN